MNDLESLLIKIKDLRNRAIENKIHAIPESIANHEKGRISAFNEVINLISKMLEKKDGL